MFEFIYKQLAQDKHINKDFNQLFDTKKTKGEIKNDCERP